MSTDEVVIINDDNHKDSDIEVVDITKENSTDLESSKNDAIVIEDDEPQTENDVIEIIDIDPDANNKQVRDYLTKVCSENRLIGEFIEKCLDLENSSGMLRVIHRTFLPLYFKMEDGYRESNDFKKLLDIKTRALEVSPNKKFSHLKSVCEIMKTFHKDRKKVPFITLATDVKDKTNKTSNQRKRRKRRKRSLTHKKSKSTISQRKSDNIIVLDDNEDSSPTDLDAQPTNNPHQSLASNANELVSDDIVIVDDNDIPNSNKENNNEINSNCKTVNAKDQSREVNTNDKVFLVPLPPCTLNENKEKMTKDRIKYIEKQIEFFKARIDVLEQEEVDKDTLCSPYIQCERLKFYIVGLYKELCSLTGSEPVKKREVRFVASDDHPQLPVKILEAHINENIGSDGNPLLPDFTDVVQCVVQANVDGKLGWSRAQIMSEARNLFTYSGQALQENRKKREWRYLLGRVNSQLDQDPADKDPYLMARLEENRRIAVKNELDLLEQYVKMEQSRHMQTTPSHFNVTQEASDDEDVNENAFVTQAPSLHMEVPIVNNGVINNNVNIFRTRHCATGNKEYSNMEFSQYVIYGSHRPINNNQEEEMDICTDARLCIPHENNSCNMLEINIENNQIPEMLVVSGPGNSNIDTSDKPAALATQENNEIRMIEVYVENDKPPEVKVINISGGDQNSVVTTKNQLEQGSGTDLRKDSKLGTTLETKIEVNEDFTENTTLVLTDNYNIENDNSTETPGNILITDVYSIAVKEENTSHHVNKSGLNASYVENSEKVLDKSMDIVNESINKERSENIGDNEVLRDVSKNNSSLVSNSELEKTNDTKDLLNYIKPELSDVLKDMEMFGDTVTATIFDIEDPFLVIEILDSSDGSDNDIDN